MGKVFYICPNKNKSIMINAYPAPGQKKADSLLYGTQRIKEFCDLNGIPMPKIADTDYNAMGYYTWGGKTIYVNTKRARTAVRTPGFSWSYTGYKADLTVAGILAHECGHYVDSRLKMISKRMKMAEAKVSSYEPNSSERFAESMKLFILNPDLLRVGRPKRYEFLTKICGLKPAIIDSWETVLGNAHPKLIAATKNWIAAK